MVFPAFKRGVGSHDSAPFYQDLRSGWEFATSRIEGLGWYLIRGDWL